MSQIFSGKALLFPNRAASYPEIATISFCCYISRALKKTELIFLFGVIYCCVCSHKGIDVLTDVKLVVSCNTKFICCAEQCGGDALCPQVECIS